MLAQEFAVDVQDVVGSGLTFQQILRYIDRAQIVILGEDINLLRVTPDPYFTTTIDTFSYVANSVCKDASAPTPGSSVGDIRIIKDIYRTQDLTDSPNPALVRQTRAEPMTLNVYDIEVHARFACVRSKSPGANDCVVKWEPTNDPGDNTTIWRARAYLWPTRVTAGAIPLAIPDDFCPDLLMEGVLRLVERRDYGRADIHEQPYLNALARFRHAYAMVPVIENTDSTPYRPC